MPVDDPCPPADSSYAAILRREIQACPLLAGTLLLVLVSMVFWVFPAIDSAFTGLFYTPETWFAARTHDGLLALRDFGIGLSSGVMIVLVLLALVRMVFWRLPAVVSGRSLAFLLSSAVLGPGLLVNLLLKDFWGRPRPHMVEIFGGAAPYVPVWEITDFCQDNCSFVSGEAASAFWLVSFVFLAPADLRRPAFIAVAAYAGILSLNRIAFGGHFLSDVLISWCLTLLVVLVMRRLILHDGAPPARDPYDRFLTAAGCRIAGMFARPRRAA